MLAWLAGRILALFGWRTEGELPNIAKYVVIAAPHTSNWDFPITILVAMRFKIRINFMMKDEMFRPLYGWFFRWLGGIPINRRSRNNVVEQSIQQFRERSRMVLVIPPEGTRSVTKRWRTGFYYIAHGANVPILLGFLDFRRKVGGFGPLIYPSGDIVADMVAIRDFYSGIAGKYPWQVGEITVESQAQPPARD